LSKKREEGRGAGQDFKFKRNAEEARDREVEVQGLCMSRIGEVQEQRGKGAGKEI
jgi:hypothetical protein